MRRKYLGVTGTKRIGAFLALASALVFFAGEPGQSAHGGTPAERAKSAESFASLAPNDRAGLQSILTAGKLAELRWPDFSHYKFSVAEFYRSTGYRLAWTSHGRPTPQALAMIRVLENADVEGLDPANYDGPRWASRIASLDAPKPQSESNLTRFDVALTVSAMRYISDVHMGRVDPRRFHSGFDVEHGKHDLAQFLLERIVHAPDIRPALEEIEPPFPIYHRMIEALHKYQDLALEYHGRPFPVPKRTIDPGDSYSNLPQLAHLLRLLGDLPAHANAGASGTVYQGALVDAVKRFQSRHGLDPDGRIGRRTFRELNTPLAHRVLQIRLSLERLRWLPHQFVRPPIVVNIPEFRLHVLNAQLRQALSMKVVVGKAYKHQTPVFASAIRSVIFRPYWDVPLSIQRKELVPDIHKDPRYLQEHDYQVVDRHRNVVSAGKVNAAILEGLTDGTLFARQRPGPDNSLGLIKFNLPNGFDIFLHATPATTLFSRSRRDFSHGCIRVQDPVALAAWVLRDNPGWTPERIRKAMDGDQTFEVKLAKPVPILIVYGTAIVTGSGKVRFFRDIYGLDAKLEQALTSPRSDSTPDHRGEGR